MLTSLVHCRYFQDDVPCTSIFVRDFPADVTPEKLVEAFSRFGNVKRGTQGVNLKNQRGKDSFAFVEFEEAAAVQAAIEGQVLINGQQVCVLTLAETMHAFYIVIKYAHERLHAHPAESLGTSASACGVVASCGCHAFEVAWQNIGMERSLSGR